MLSISTLVERLSSLHPANGGVYSTCDLAVVLERSHPSLLNKSIRLLIRQGVLHRVRRGLYVDRLHGYRPEIVGRRWLAPSYLSTETALDRHQLCDTGISAYTYVTTRLLPRREAARRILEGRQFIYRHLARHLFFGYRVEAGIWLAEPEKAVIDFLYFVFKNQRSVLSPEDIDFSQLNATRYRQYLRPYRQTGFKAYALSWLQERGRRR